MSVLFEVEKMRFTLCCIKLLFWLLSLVLSVAIANAARKESENAVIKENRYGARNILKRGTCMNAHVKTTPNGG